MFLNSQKTQFRQFIVDEKVLITIFFIESPIDIENGEYYKITRKILFGPRHEISNNVVCATSKGSDQPAHTRSLIRAFASRLNIL